MREGWNYYTLGSVCDIYQPQTIATSQLQEDGAFPVFGANGIIGRYICYNHTDPEVLLTCRGATCGKVNVSLPFSWINGNAMVIHKKAEYDIDFGFLKYLMMSLDYNTIITGAAQPQITRHNLSPTIVGFPSLENQLKIVEELDQINALIAIKEKQLRELEELEQTIFHEMFGDPVLNEKKWDIRKISEMGSVKTGNTPSRSNKSYYSSNHIEWIKTDNIVRGQLHASLADEFLSQEGANVGRVSMSGSVLVACIAGSISSIGKACLLDRDAAFNQQINSIEPNDSFLGRFLYGLIEASSSYIQSKASNGMKHILSKSAFEEIELIAPPKNIQQEYVECVAEIDKLKMEAEQTKNELGELFASRMQYWFD